MASRYFSTDITISDPPIEAFADDHIHILAGTDVVSATTAIFSRSTAGDVQVYVDGRVTGTSSAIALQGPGANQVVIYEGGSATGGTGSTITFRASGTSSVVNHGTIDTGDNGTGITFLTWNNYLYNTGTIGNEQTLQGVTVGTTGPNQYPSAVIINTGTIFGTYAAIVGGPSADHVVNRGTIHGDVLLWGGANVYDGQAGQVIGNVYGTGTFIGGAFSDQFSGGTWLVGNGGADTMGIGIDASTETVFGGTTDGIDDSLSDTISVFWNFDGINTIDPELGVNIFLAEGYISQTQPGQPVVAWILDFENAIGGSGDDALLGSAADNILDGGKGGDWLVGGLGADTFRFSAIGEIEPADQIADFSRSDGDRIDLSRIDANFRLADDQAFVFRTTHTHNAAGEAVVTNFAGGARVDLYTDATDRVSASFFVGFADPDFALQATDFIL